MKDRFVKFMLIVIAVLLALNCATNLRGPADAREPADAQGNTAKFGYVLKWAEGPVMPGGGWGKQVIDLRNGNIWAFPNDLGQPVYVGRYNFEAMDNLGAGHK